METFRNITRRPYCIIGVKRLTRLSLNQFFEIINKCNIKQADSVIDIRYKCWDIECSKCPFCGNDICKVKFSSAEERISSINNMIKIEEEKYNKIEWRPLELLPEDFIAL